MSSRLMYDFCLMPTKDSYSESLKYRTIMFEGVNGAKSSKSSLTEPKRVVRYTAVVFLTHKHRQFLNGFMAGLTFKVSHPLWGRYAMATSATTGTTIYCNTDNSDFAVGEKVFIVSGMDKYVVSTITAVAATFITVADSVTVTVGQYILPSFDGILTGDIASDYTGENYAVCNLSIEELR